MKNKKSYIFDDAGDREEFERLRLIEAARDPETIKRLEATGVGRGWRCLEIGPGAGSILHWLADRAGSARVTALDLNPRFAKAWPDVTIVRGDVSGTDLPETLFDLIHARYVFLHVRDWRKALSRTAALLAPGGFLVVEDADWGYSHGITGPTAVVDSINRVGDAIRRMYAAMGLDYEVGRGLVKAFKDEGILLRGVEFNLHQESGGAPTATYMKASVRQIRDRLLATGAVSPADIDAYVRAAEAGTARTSYYATVAVTGRRPKSPPAADSDGDASVYHPSGN